jgi:hypothetical protein
MPGVYLTCSGRKCRDASQFPRHLRFIDPTSENADHLWKYTCNVVQADERDEDVFVFGEEVGSGMAITTASNALVRVCLHKVLKTEHSGRNEGQGWSSPQILLLVEERNIGVNL